MKQVANAKHSIAWFKLAEFVARGEKERALGIYRLLAISINDKAFSRQLEGDILLAFEDIDAKEKYEQAAELYLEQGNYNAAAAIFMNLIFISPENNYYWDKTIGIYKDQKNHQLHADVLVQKIHWHLKNNDIDLACKLVNEIEAIAKNKLLYAKETIILNLVQNKATNYHKKIVEFIGDLSRESPKDKFEKLKYKLSDLSEQYHKIANGQ